MRKLKRESSKRESRVEPGSPARPRIRGLQRSHSQAVVSSSRAPESSEEHVKKPVKKRATKDDDSDDSPTLFFAEEESPPTDSDDASSSEGSEARKKTPSVDTEMLTKIAEENSKLLSQVDSSSFFPCAGLTWS